MISARQALGVVVECLQPEAGGSLSAERRRAVVDWARPLALANDHFLAPAMYAGLAEAGGLDGLPADVCAYLALLHRLNRDRNAALRRQAVELVQALGAVGVKPLLLKGGVALFGDVYPDPAARMVRDLDLLVPHGSEDRVVAALQGLGYRIATRYEAGHNAYADFVRPHDPGAVDLHRELIEMPYLLPSSEVWAHAQDAGPPEARFLVPSRTDAMLHHLLHAQIHYQGNFYRAVLELRQLHEFAVLVRRHQTEIDWERVAQRFHQHRLTCALESYALTAQRLFDSPWPLSRPPSRMAAIHSRRCVLQLYRPQLAKIGVPWANVRAAFAWHRMNQFYATRGSLAIARGRHVIQFLRKKTTRYAVGRLFRAH